MAPLLVTDTIECTPITNDFNLLEKQIILFYFYVGLHKVATGNNIRGSFVYAMEMAENFILSGIWSVKTGHAKNLAILLPWCLTFPPLLEAGAVPFKGRGQNIRIPLLMEKEVAHPESTLQRCAQMNPKWFLFNLLALTINIDWGDEQKSSTPYNVFPIFGSSWIHVGRNLTTKLIQRTFVLFILNNHQINILPNI